MGNTAPTFKGFIDYNINVGTEGMHIRGKPGSGKSNTALSICSWILDRGGVIIMRGTKNCEWRHFYRVTQCEKITIFIPIQLKPKDDNDQPIKFKRIPKKYYVDFEYVDFEKLNLEEYIKPKHVFVLYDHCFNVAQRCWLIVDQLRYLCNRSDNEFDEDLDELPITFLEHEAQVVFPMCPLAPRTSKLSNKHWHAVNVMQQIAVDFRKDLMRPLYVAQLSSQFDALLRDLCSYKVYKTGTAGNDAPTPVKKSTPFLKIHQCNIVVSGGQYIQRIPIAKFPEKKEKWKMIPMVRIEYKCLEERLAPSKDDKKNDGWMDTRNKVVKELYEGGFTQKRLAELFETTQQRMSQIVTA